MARSLYEEPGLQTFVDRLDRFPLLEREQELELARRYREGDEEAGSQLVESHLRSVVKMAHKYRGYGIYLSDLIAEGNLGLLEAVRRFEPERGLRFLTYARYWIRAYMLSHILKHWSIVDLGTTALQSKMFFRLQAEHARLANQLGANDDDAIAEKLAAKFDTSVDNVRTSLSRLRRRDTSLDVPIMPDSSTTFGEMLTDDAVDQESAAASAEVAGLVQNAVQRLWPSLDCRERLILNERLLPDPAREPETLAALGRRLGVTRERVRQVEVQLKSKLRTSYETVTSGDGPPDLVQLTARSQVQEQCDHCRTPELCAA